MSNPEENSPKPDKLMSEPTHPCKDDVWKWEPAPRGKRPASYMTMRESIACQQMAGLIANARFGDTLATLSWSESEEAGFHAAAKSAVMAADALLAELERDNNGTKET